MENIIIATIKEWNIRSFFKLEELNEDKYKFYLISNKEELTYENVSKINPKYIFFPHWSWIIKEEIYSNYQCIVFHMTDLPFGRGGSPLQNLIIKEIYDTKITALKVDGGLDTGDIYFKENFNISIGSAEENFQELSRIIFEKMIPRILKEDIIPQKQTGKIVQFKRRTKDDSDLNKLSVESKRKLYDIIRMLDAEGYPKAYLNLNNLKIEFSEVQNKNGKLVGRFEVEDNE